MKRYSENGITVVIDKGSGVTGSWWGSIAAFPGVAEKGYLDVEITVDMRSGHSSLPPDDNSITVMAEIIQELNANKYDTTLDENNPIMETIFCSAQHEKAMPAEESERLATVDRGEGSVEELVDTTIASHPSMGGFFRAIQSIGIIYGRRKVNVVPGHTSLRINHRVSGACLLFVTNAPEQWSDEFHRSSRAVRSRTSRTIWKDS